MTSFEENNRIFFVIDDHPVVKEMTIASLKQKYQGAEVFEAQTAVEAREKLQNVQPDAVIVDLSIPETLGETSQAEIGINLLKTFLKTYPEYNFIVQSAYSQALIRIKPLIDQHQGGFTVIDKGDPISKMLASVAQSLERNVSIPRQVRGSIIEIKPEWLQVLTLAFQESMTDKAISQEMNIAERTVRAYWSKLYDALEIFPEEGRSNRLQTEKKAREKGLID